MSNQPKKAKTFNLPLSAWGDEDRFDGGRAIVTIDSAKEEEIKRLVECARQVHAIVPDRFRNIDVKESDFVLVDSRGRSGDDLYEVFLRISENGFYWEGKLDNEAVTFQTKFMNLSELLEYPADDRIETVTVQCRSGIGDLEECVARLDPRSGRVFDLDLPNNDYDEIVFPDDDMVEVSDIEGELFVTPEYIDHVRSKLDDLQADGGMAP